jgi:hypothetical protein
VAALVPWALALAWMASACGPKVPPKRPTDEEDLDAWEDFCAKLDTCSACLTEPRCGFCPTSGACLFFDEQHQGALARCESVTHVADVCGGGSAKPSASAASAPSPAASGLPHGAPAGAPRQVRAARGATVVELSSTPGMLVDAHAPPPPPGSTPATHPALSGSCAGDPVGCSEAGTAVRAAATFDDAVAALRKLGFDVEPR